MALANKRIPDMRIAQIHPDTSWNRVWQNLHSVWTSEKIKEVWYMVIHDVISTNDRLAKIRLRASNLCTVCGRTDTLQNRLTECTEGADLWRWTCSQISTILRTDPKNVRPEWTIRSASSSGLHYATGPSYGYSPTRSLTAYNGGG